MSQLKPLLTTEEKELSEQELKELENYLFLADPEQLDPFLIGFMKFMRAVDGLPIEQEQVLAGLLDVKSRIERTRYNTILDLKKHVTCHLITKAYPWLKAFKNLADTEDEHFVSYKGLGRQEAIEILKAKGMISQGIAPIFLGHAPQPEQTKRRWFNRRKGETVSEQS